MNNQHSKWITEMYSAALKFVNPLAFSIFLLHKYELGMSRSDHVVSDSIGIGRYLPIRTRIYIFSLFFNTSIVMRWHRVRPLDSTRKQQRVRHDITLLQRRYWLNAGVVPKSADYASPRWNRTRLPNPNPTPNPNPFPTPTPKPTNTRGCIIWQAAEFGTTPAK